MSKLKQQLKVILPSLSRDANHNRDPEVKFRLYALKAIVESKKDVKKACEARGVSTDFFYEWGGRLLRARDVASLASRSRKPKRSPTKTRGRIERKIRRLRVAEPAHGPERISFYLRKLFKISCAPSTVYNVLSRLGFVDKDERKTRSKKHLKRYTRPVPGYLQMDIKYVPFRIEGRQYYEFNVVDHCSSWRLIRSYRDKSYDSLTIFLNELQQECPFAIIQIQTDNGKEFTDKYRVNSNGLPTEMHPLDVWCAKRKIEHKLIPIGVKELNGKVENTHGFDDREFYSKTPGGFKNYDSLERNTRGWNERWNKLRHTRKLGWRTPNEVLEAAYVAYLTFLLTWSQQSHAVAQLNDQGVFEMRVPSAPQTRKIKKSRRKTAVDRYLTWIEGEEKKSLKSIIAVPVMSQIFPWSLKAAQYHRMSSKSDRWRNARHWPQAERKWKRARPAVLGA
jgi:transposase InsO family protein